MISKQYNFEFVELTLDLPAIHSVLGFPDSELPDPFSEYLGEALDFAAQITEISACYRIIDEIRLDPSTGSIHAGGKTFQVGKTVCKELRYAEQLMFFVCTAGKVISQKSTELLMGEDPAKGYIFDQVGTFIAEAACDRMQKLIQEELPPGKKITNRYSPGYCQWNVADQHLLFSLFPLAPCGVILTDSALMNPVKSISGVIGIGMEVHYRDYPCALCLSVNCIYRKLY
jgi:hypothetical protein